MRKDVERSFGNAIQKTQYLARSIRQWYIEDIKVCVSACVIFHNISVRRRREIFFHKDLMKLEDVVVEPIAAADDTVKNRTLFGQAPSEDYVHPLGHYIETINTNIENGQLHNDLQKDMIEHVWNNYKHPELK